MQCNRRIFQFRYDGVLDKVGRAEDVWGRFNLLCRREIFHVRSTRVRSIAFLLVCIRACVELPYCSTLVPDLFLRDRLQDQATISVFPLSPTGATILCSRRVHAHPPSQHHDQVYWRGPAATISNGGNDDGLNYPSSASPMDQHSVKHRAIRFS